MAGSARPASRGLGGPIAFGAGTLALALAAMALLRLAVVATLPDSDTDAYGHFAAARALLAHPDRVADHWVWLPGWHGVLALLITMRAGFVGARLFNAALAILIPIVLYRMVRPRSERAAIVAALAMTIVPLSSLLATSAQSETLFALSLVGGAAALARGRGLVAGACLAVACLLRYEAWAATVALGVGVAVRGDARSRRATALAIVFACAPVIAWCAIRARADGRWFAFIPETIQFVGGPGHGMGLLGLLHYTLFVPAKVLGPTVLLALIGVRAAARVAPELAWASLGILAFLTATCVFGGSLGLDRHFAALVPFACVAIGFGALRVSEAWTRAGAAALVATLAVHVVWYVSSTRARWDAQQAAAEWVDANSAGAPVVCPSVALQLLTHLPSARFVEAPPLDGPSVILGWESQLGPLASEGWLAGRWRQSGAAGECVVVRVVDRARAFDTRSQRSSATSGTN